MNEVIVVNQDTRTVERKNKNANPVRSGAFFKGYP